MPGIHLYSSNRLEILAETFARLQRSKPLPPLQTETVLVQSRGMARWLAMETARSIKIWANVIYPFPNTFIRQIYKLLLPDIPDISCHEKKYIVWQLMEILPEFTADIHFANVASYLRSGDELKLYQLAFELADLFEQYTLYRPQMILAWETDSTKISAAQVWQAMVWRRLVEHINQQHHLPEPHRARLLQLFEEKIHSPAFDRTLLPERISIFGISSLPPYHIKVLAGLSDHIDIHFFIMNPCMEYWLDIITDRHIVKISRQQSTSQETLHLKQGNSLLASMGQLGRDFMAMLHDFNTQDHELFIDPGNESLLAHIQQDILLLRENPNASSPAAAARLIKDSDSSVSFHSCHSPMREIENLHDQLLELLCGSDADEPLEPQDILVMAPDIDAYIPLIKAVFDKDHTSVENIPYSISDQSVRNASQYIETFLQILSVVHSRLSSIDVLKILETSAVQNRFAISGNDVSTIKNWIEKTRIRWGIDQDHKMGLQLPPHGENTWRAGLDRLLLGYAMPGDERILFNDILPYDHIEGSNTEVLGNFLDFCTSLFSLAETLQQEHSLKEWSEILLQTKENLLLADDTSETEDRTLHQLLYELRELQNRTNFNTRLSLGPVRSFLTRSLDERFSSLAGAGGFMTGGVTFCSMLPMRAIPCKIICLLGMDDGLYPRSVRRNSFDLLALEPKRGDRSKRLDDRYLFLEAILSARQRLLISFVGQSIEDGTPRPPSVLVSELMDYIDQGYVAHHNMAEPGISLSGKLTTIHHLHPFHPDYFTGHTELQKAKLFSYSAENSEAASILLADRHDTGSMFTTPRTSPPAEYKQVKLHELVRFFSHPGRYFLVEIIGIAPIEEKQSFETDEPFSLAGLARYKIENEILEYMIQGRDTDILYQIKKASGELPHGRLGETSFMQLVSELQSFHKMLAELFRGNDFTPRQISLTISDYTITGQFDLVSASAMVQYRHATIKPNDVIRSWISHLVFNCMQSQASAESGPVTYHAGKEAIYKYRPVAESLSLLGRLLDLYWLGLQQPLYFFPHSSFVYARELHNGKTEVEALRKAEQQWHGDGFRKTGEKYDPYNRICCRNLNLADPQFKEQAKSVFLPALDHRTKLNLHALQKDPENR